MRMRDSLASVMHIFYQEKDREMQNFGSKTAILNALTDQSSFSARILQINGTLRLLSERELNEYHF
jgi:hypothetical protein